MMELFVTCEIGGRLVALPAKDVVSVIELDDIYPVPLVKNHVLGMAAVRSLPLTVVDCRLSLGLPVMEESSERSPIVKLGEHQYALIVDRVDDAIEGEFAPDAQSLPLGNNWAKVCSGTVETAHGPALVIDVESLILGETANAA